MKNCNLSSLPLITSDVPLTWYDWFKMIKKGDIQQLEAWQERGIPFPDPFTDKEGNSPFHIAAITPHIDIYKFFESHIDGDTSPSKIRNRICETPLLLAASHGNLKMVSYLLSHGSFINEKDFYGRTSLLAAAKNGHLDIVEFLLAHGGSVDKKSNSGMTSLHLATNNGHFEMVECLLQHGSNAKEKANGGMTSLLYAAEKGVLNIVRSLLEHGSDIGEIDKYGRNAIVCAAQNDHIDVIEFLVSVGAMDNSVFPIEHLDEPSFRVLEVLINEGCTTLEEIQTICSAEHFSEFFQDMKRKKTNKRVARDCGN